MNAKIKKHLTLDDRIDIQILLKEGKNFIQIADHIGKDRSTISREIKAHRYLTETTAGNDCIHRIVCDNPKTCKRRDACFGNRSCRIRCKLCRIDCDRYEKESCIRHNKPPYVCSACETKSKCWLTKMEYEAKRAHGAYETLRSESRQGISLAEEDLDYLNSVVSRQIKQGQSIPVIWENYKDEMPISGRTLYKYVEHGLLDAKNLDLRRRVRMPQRKKSGPVLRIDKQCHIGRTFEDYRSYVDENPDAAIVQMDTVEGRKGGKVLLTLLFTNCDLQLMYLRERNTAASVIQVFDHFRERLGNELFQGLFQVLLTDRGSEFTDPIRIETDLVTGELQCKVFYCDPGNSNQKSNCEKNHGLIRYVLPKGKSMDKLTQEDITKMMNHINSYPRKKWNGQSPIDLFTKIYGQQASNKLGLVKIPPESIILTPALLK